MKYLVSKTEILTIGFGLIFTTINTLPARAATLWWDLELFDNQGEILGTGEFSYDLATTDVIEYEDPITRQLITTSHNQVLETFSVEMMGENWSLNDSNLRDTLWWETNSSNATQSVILTSVGYFNETSFGFTQPPFTSRFSDEFNLQGSSTENLGTGTWSQNLIGSSIQDEGTWTASLRNSDNSSDNRNIDSPTKTVSEPFSIVSLLLVGMIGLFRKKL